MLRALIRRGPSVNLADKDGATLPIAVGSNGQARMVEWRGGVDSHRSKQDCPQ